MSIFDRCVLQFLFNKNSIRLWPEAKKFKKKQLEGKFDFSPETKAYIETLRTGTEDPILEDVLAKIKKRQEDKNSDELWFVKLTKSKPDI